MPPPLKLPTTLRSRILLSAPVADEFRKLCKIVGAEPDAMLTRLMDDYVRMSGVRGGVAHLVDQSPPRRRSTKTPARRSDREVG